MNKSILSILCGLTLGTITPLHADVLSHTVPPDLVEPSGLYHLNNPDVVLMTAKTVINNAGPCSATNDYAHCTFADILKNVDTTGNFKPEIKVLFTTNGLAESGDTNATMRLRGQASRFAPQKSFRIKLNSKKNLWRGERRIQLIKSVFDFSRVRNALSYELLVDIPALTSLRTQFVNLYIDDSGASKDYGFYTHVEHIGKEYLVNRHWDKDSGLYKAEHFNFKNSLVYKLDASGKPVNKVAFENNLEIKRGKNHKKLVEMLTALNDPTVDFNKNIMGKYFNIENYLSWFAFNILINNTDTENKNFYLYNPKGKEVFYLTSWDNDFTWGVNLEDPEYNTVDHWPRWWYSQANWWDIKLHQRFLTQEGNVDLLKSAVTEMRNRYLTPAKIKAITDKYFPLVAPRVTVNPDLAHLYVEVDDTQSEKLKEYTRLFKQLKDNVEKNYTLFLARVDDPMTFELDEAVIFVDGKVEFNWDTSVSLLKHGITYDLDISTSSSFKAPHIVESIRNIPKHYLVTDWHHPKGTYYYRVIARDVHAPKQHWQEAENESDTLFLPNTEIPLYGVVKFKAPVKGTAATANSKPTASNMTVTVKAARSIILQAKDNDNDRLKATVVEAPKHGKVTRPQGLKLSYTPNAGYSGVDSFRYVVGDKKSFSNVAIVNLKVQGNSNTAPVAFNKTATTLQNKTIKITLKATDADAGDVLSYTLKTQPSQGTATRSGSTLHYTPKTGFIGVDQIKFVASDGKATSNQATIRVKVTKKPVSGVTISNPVGETSIRLDGKTDDWQSLRLFSADANDIANKVNNRIDWKGASIAHNANDVFFLYKNHNPIPSRLSWGWQAFMDTDGSSLTGYKYNGGLGADYLLEGSTLLRYIGTGNNWRWKTVGQGVMKASGKEAELRFPRRWIGRPDKMKIAYLGNNEAESGQGIDQYPNNSGSFNYQFSAISTTNHIPTAGNQSLVTTKNKAKAITLSGHDVDTKDVLSYKILTQPAQGKLTGQQRDWHYTPNKDYKGQDAFTYQVNDGKVNSAVAKVSIKVSDTPTNSSAISNPIANNAIVLDGKVSDWASLNKFPVDTDNASTASLKPINWQSASIAHTNKDLYLLYQNKTAANLPLKWGWQTFLDTDGNANTGYPLNNHLGADYIIEGDAVMRYTGKDGDWNWRFIGNTNVSKLKSSHIELRFPRQWVGDPALMTLAFYGSNNAFSLGGTSDAYPDNALTEPSNNAFFSYQLGGQGKAVAITAKKGYKSSNHHQPSASSMSHEPKRTKTTASVTTKKAGGSSSWAFLLLSASLIVLRRRYYQKSE